MASLILSAIVLLGVFIGPFLFFKPALAIEIQRRFYARINWRIEPISMAKELRNTKWMGLILIFLSLATLIYLWKINSSV